MNVQLQKSKHVIITNAVPLNLKPLLAQTSVSLTDRKPKKYLITLKSRTNRTTTTNQKDIQCPNFQSAYRKFIINDEDILKGKSMFDSSYRTHQPKLERIDEQSVLSQTTITLENHNIKHSQSLIDVRRVTEDYSKMWSTKEDSVAKKENRLTGGCFFKNKKSDEYIGQAPIEEPTKPGAEPVMEDDPTNSIDQLFTKVAPIADDENCKRIELLEEQIEKMHMELKHIRNEIVPPEDLQKYSTLSERLNEINSILLDLKINCLHVKDTSDENKTEKNINESKYSPSSQQCRPELPKIIIQPPTTICRGYGPKICTSRHVPRIPNLEEGSDCSNESLPYNGLKPPKDDCTRTVKAKYPNRNYYYNNPQDINETPKPPYRSCEYKPRHIFPQESSKSCESSESSSDNDTNTGYNWDISPINSAYWQPVACSTPQQQKQRQFQHQSCKQDYTSQTLPMTSNIRSCSEVNNRQSVSPKYLRKLQTLNRNDCQFPQTPRNLEEEERDIRINRATAPHAKRTYNQCNKRRRKSAGRDSLFSSTDLSSPEASTRKMHKTYDTTKRCIHSDIPLVAKNLPKAIKNIINNLDPDNIALTVVLESNNMYHITVSVSHTGQSLGCVYATESALKRAESNDFFESFLTFFVLNSNNTLEQRNKMFGLLH